MESSMKMELVALLKESRMILVRNSIGLTEMNGKRYLILLNSLTKDLIRTECSLKIKANLSSYQVLLDVENQPQL